MADHFGLLSKRLGFYAVTNEPGVTDETVRNFEKELGQSLPDDYRNFLLHHGKSTAPRLVFPDPDQPSKPGGGVEVFYGLQRSGGYNLLSEWQGMKGIIQPGLFPIADSPGGLICIVLSGDQRGAVYWWAAEDSRTGGDDDLYQLAPSFTDFFTNLFLHDD